MPRASASPIKSPEQPSVPPEISATEWELALLRSAAEARPTGPHKHVAVLRLQAEMQRRLGIWVSTTQIWDRLAELYDLDALDDMASTSTVSLPTTPTTLSPLPRQNPYHPTSPTPHSTSKSKSKKEPPSIPIATSSKSAAIINSKHFNHTFTLPAIGIDESDVYESEEWLGLIYPRADDEDDKADVDWDEERDKWVKKHIVEEPKEKKGVARAQSHKKGAGRRDSGAASVKDRKDSSSLSEEEGDDASEAQTRRDNSRGKGKAGNAKRKRDTTTVERVDEEESVDESVSPVKAEKRSKRR